MMQAHTRQARLDSPFLPGNIEAYQRWRDRKLARQPAGLADLVVEIDNPLVLRAPERQALLAHCRASNMALYFSRRPAGREAPLALGRQLGLHGLDHNWLADEDGLTPLTVAESGERNRFIPYSNRPIKWHTDGYYNAPDRQIRGLLLHCEQRAVTGGENALMDHEIAYLLLRETDPAHIHALMAADVMTIPARMEGEDTARGDQTGPVFSVDAVSGNLHMRYTARARNVRWKDDVRTRDAVACLEQLLHEASPYVYRGLLEPGMGLISNNVLHDRAGFSDVPERRRLLYRARYYDRIAGTDWDADDGA